jgi:hypothetical protein
LREPGAAKRISHLSGILPRNLGARNRRHARAATAIFEAGQSGDCFKQRRLPGTILADKNRDGGRE